MSKWTCLVAVLAVLLLTAGAGFASAPWTTPTAEGAAADDGWRRTRDGWERLEQLLPHVSPLNSPWRRFHPGLVAALQVLLAAGVFAAWEGARQDVETIQKGN